MKKFFVLLVLVITAIPTFAQIRGNNIVIIVSPDHQDWNYKVGEKATFSVQVFKSSTLVDNVQVDYEAGPDMYPDVKKSTTLKDGTMKYTATMNKPGFYRFKVKAHVGGKDYVGLSTAAFSPEKLQPYAQCPKDFDEFWNKALADARKNDLNPTRTLLPERCTKDVNVYEVSFVNNRWGSRIYGILCLPVNCAGSSCTNLSFARLWLGICFGQYNFSPLFTEKHHCACRELVFVLCKPRNGCSHEENKKYQSSHFH